MSNSDSGSRRDLSEKEKKECEVEARRANNEFLKLRPISDELCIFMKISLRSRKNQVEVTQKIMLYIRKHKCYDPNFIRRIIPDAKLTKLLRVKDNEEVTYLNLQEFLKIHFLI